MAVEREQELTQRLFGGTKRPADEEAGITTLEDSALFTFDTGDDSAVAADATEQVPVSYTHLTLPTSELV